MTTRYIARASDSLQTMLLLMTAVACLIYSVGVASGQSVSAEATPQEIVSRLALTTAEAPSEETEALIIELQSRGEAAIAAIEDGLAPGKAPLSLALVRTLGGIAGDSSTSLLLKVAAQRTSPQPADRALSALENREVRRPLSLDELQALTALVREGQVLKAGLAARVLGNCVMVPERERLAPILQRFEEEVVSPSEVGNIGLSYLSPRVSVLSQFLLAVSYVGEKAIPALIQKQQGIAGDSELEKWFTLALGMAGDPLVSAELERMVSEEADRYIRAVAVRAYARSAGSDA
ncbi:MAG: hypothetical protein GTO55_01830, partial [Armatimonadetes bacterium]|nr:hypothetical protein [Armatimonadota bacterium]NIM23019.1 hypothetical protein [Armatimonadota bacterium]NIM66887.1 hypothetical protein [Armatimonadota bacterium]NIN05078.1 hypothetical protein [Armatimonadota bacterium]NIO96127.1 hypothetical protein [Armatimonadota bacterium]